MSGRAVTPDPRVGPPQGAGSSVQPPADRYSLEGLRVAFEAGFRAHERGESMEAAWARIMFGTDPTTERVDLNADPDIRSAHIDEARSMLASRRRRK